MSSLIFFYAAKERKIDVIFSTHTHSNKYEDTKSKSRRADPRARFSNVYVTSYVEKINTKFAIPS